MTTCLKDSIVNALSIIIEPGQVTEVRALHATTPNYRRPHTESGYFDDPVKLADSVINLSAAGIYFIPNPVNSGLLSRAVNRIRTISKDSLTSDLDIAKRRWLYIDADPRRPSGISSTDEEHERALEKIIEIKRFLTMQGWPEPVRADSGNGGHLLYRIDLPSNDEGLIKRVLEALAFKFDDEYVDIDQTVFNPARIWKLYGTVARKGDSTKERPYRIAKILKTPSTLKSVRIDLLQNLAAQVPEIPKPENNSYCSESRFDLGKWIDEHNLKVEGPTPWQGGQKWIFHDCPWNPDHRDRSAYLLQLASGAISAGCHHNGCKDKDWYALRILMEPNKSNNQSDKNELDELNISQPKDEVLPFPTEALPNCLKSLVEQGMKANSCPADFIAIPALNVMGVAIGNSRILQVKQGWTFRGNLYTNILALAGSGKSPALTTASSPIRKLQKVMADEYKINLEGYESTLAVWEVDCALAKKNKKPKPPKPEEPFMDEIYTTDTTIEALAQTMDRNQRGMAIILDELTSLVNGLNQYKGGRGADREAYLSLWSGTDTKINRSKKQPIILHEPFLSVMGCMPPAVLSSLVDEKGRGEDGFIHRILFSYPDPVHQVWTEEIITSDVLTNYHELFNELRGLPNDQQVLTLDQEAKEYWVKLFNENLDEMAAIDFPENLRGPWAKMPSQLARITLIIHCVRYATRETKKEQVDKVSMAKAGLIIDYFKSHARRVYSQLSESLEDKQVRRILEWCKKHKKDIFTTRELRLAKLCKSIEEIDTLFKKMQKRGFGTIQKNQGRGKQSTSFKLKDNVEKCGIVNNANFQ